MFLSIFWNPFLFFFQIAIAIGELQGFDLKQDPTQLIFKQFAWVLQTNEATNNSWLVSKNCWAQHKLYQ